MGHESGCKASAKKLNIYMYGLLWKKGSFLVSPRYQLRPGSLNSIVQHLRIKIQNNNCTVSHVLHVCSVKVILTSNKGKQEEKLEPYDFCMLRSCYFLSIDAIFWKVPCTGRLIFCDGVIL